MKDVEVIPSAELTETTLIGGRLVAVSKRGDLRQWFPRERRWVPLVPSHRRPSTKERARETETA